ncbi:MAG: hypothetical protein AAF580_06430 [Pseudomonadota bacterium]
MTGNATDARVLTALRRSAQREPTQEEVREQRVSFIMGSLKENSTVTRERVGSLIDRLEGRRGSS